MVIDKKCIRNAGTIMKRSSVGSKRIMAVRVHVNYEKFKRKTVKNDG